MFRCQDFGQDSLCKRINLFRLISVTRCPERCDATRSTRLSRDTKSIISYHAWPDCRAWRKSRFATILGVISKSSQLSADLFELPVPRDMCSLSCVAVYSPPLLGQQRNQRLPFVSEAIARACIQCWSRILQENVPRSASALPSLARAFRTAKSTAMVGLSSRSQGVSLT